MNEDSEIITHTGIDQCETEYSNKNESYTSPTTDTNTEQNEDQKQFETKLIPMMKMVLMNILWLIKPQTSEQTGNWSRSKKQLGTNNRATSF